MKTNELEMRLLGAYMTGGPADVAKAVYLGITEQTFPMAGSRPSGMAWSMPRRTTDAPTPSSCCDAPLATR